MAIYPVGSHLIAIWVFPFGATRVVVIIQVSAVYTMDKRKNPCGLPSITTFFV